MSTLIWILSAIWFPQVLSASTVAPNPLGGSTFEIRVSKFILHCQEEAAEMKPIEEVTTEDQALSRPDTNPDGPLAFQPVVQTFQNTTDTVVWITVVDEDGTEDTFGVTPFHPIWVEDTQGDVVLMADLTATEANAVARYLTASKNAPTRAGPNNIYTTIATQQGWVYAHSLRPGHVLLSPGRTPVAVLRSVTECDINSTFNFEVENAHTYYTTATGVWVHNQSLPTLVFDPAEMPNIAANISAAISSGHSDIITHRPDLAIQNRSAALRGLGRAGDGLSWDEYPFASSLEGGAGARVRAVPVHEQNLQGNRISQFIQRHRIQPGDQYRVAVLGDTRTNVPDIAQPRNPTQHTLGFTGQHTMPPCPRSP